MNKINSKSTKAEMEAYIAELEAKLNAQNTQKDETNKEVVKQPTVKISNKNDDSVTLVYCSDSLGFAEISNMEFHFNCYGEQFKVPRYQFDELVGKYRSWFDNGILAVAPEDYAVAAAKRIHTSDEFILDSKTLNSLGSMKAQDIEKLWEKIENIEQKKSMVTFVKKKFIEGDAKYRNREKIDLFNRLTDGAFEREQDELSGRFKYTQVDL